MFFEDEVCLSNLCFMALIISFN